MVEPPSFIITTFAAKIVPSQLIELLTPPLTFGTLRMPKLFTTLEQPYWADARTFHINDFMTVAVMPYYLQAASQSLSFTNFDSYF